MGACGSRPIQPATSHSNLNDHVNNKQHGQPPVPARPPHVSSMASSSKSNAVTAFEGWVPEEYEEASVRPSTEVLPTGVDGQIATPQHIRTSASLGHKIGSPLARHHQPTSPVRQAHMGVQTDQHNGWQPGPSMPLEWRKGAPVGSGSFGTVYLALNTYTGELLVVKEVSVVAEGSKGREAVEQLEHEVELLSSLQHPNIVKYVGTVRQGDALLIFLEYVPGGSIASLLTRFGALTEPVIRCFTRQLLEGLAYLHLQRTAHRDIKGANLLVETSGRVKLADFGMAKQMVEAASFTQSFKGSAFWMAPEVIRQQGHGVAADIWSVGCTVIELATGKPPWAQCATQVQAIFKIASSQEVPSIPETLSPLASEFILLCLQRDPARRPTASDLLNHPWVNFTDEWRIPALAGMLQGPQAWSATPGPQPAPRGGNEGLPGLVSGSRRATQGAVSEQPGMSSTGRPAIPLQAAMAQMSEAELDDALTSLVLGPAANNRAASGKVPGGVGAAAQSSYVAGSADGLVQEEVDWQQQPNAYKVTGLLTLPPLKMLTGGGMLPALQLGQSS